MGSDPIHLQTGPPRATDHLATTQTGLTPANDDELTTKDDLHDHLRLLGARNIEANGSGWIERCKSVGRSWYGLSGSLMGINDDLKAIKRRCPVVAVTVPLMTGQENITLHALAARWRADDVLATAVSDAWTLPGIDERTAMWVWAFGCVPKDREEARLTVHRRGHKNSSAQAMSALSAISWMRAKAALLRSLLLCEAQYRDAHPSAIARPRREIAEAPRGRSDRR